MNICIPRERRDSEYRVGLTPAGVQLLTQAGHNCYVEHDAGLGSGFSDYDYQMAGAQIVYSGEEAYGRADLLLKVARPTEEEFEWMRPGQAVMGFLHLAAGSSRKIETLLAKKITAIGYEVIQRDDGSLPVLSPMSRAGGRMTPQIAAMLCQNNFGGKGILLGGTPGVPPAEVVILGGGTSGTAAARVFLGMGAMVYILDHDQERLQYLDTLFQGRVITMVSHDFNITKVCRFADVLVGAVLIPGARTPVLVSRQMVREMRPRSVIIDLSIDQGGCIETSRPTTHSNPTYIDENVLHYCVPNMTGVLGRTATHTLNNACWPFVQQIAAQGIEAALEANPAIRRGVYTHQGEIVHPNLRASMEGRLSA
ncbi:MAG: alanine dehydrogenase [Anaerolineae bacterium]|nr:MAG: alanine dehydrogenase [Anaerolineae bacterium]